MDNSACAVVYLDRRVQVTGSMTKELLQRKEEDHTTRHGDEDATHNINTIVSAFGEAFICSDGLSCLNEIDQLEESRSSSPIIVLLDMPADDEPGFRTPTWDAQAISPDAPRQPKAEKSDASDLYGTQLLLYLASDVQRRARSRLVICVALLRSKFDFMTESTRMSKYLDAGAVDVLTCPLTTDRLQALAVPAYRRLKEVSRESSTFVLSKRNRKLSWVGIEEEQPYAYLREAMVSSLMNGICNPETVGDSLDHSGLSIDPTKKQAIAAAVGKWGFSAHDFDPDELLYAALLILEHALSMPELEQWRMSTDDLITFLMACRRAYNDFVLYHNFTHVVDVLQAIFYFLLQIGILPPYHASEREASASDSAIAQEPAERPPAATLLRPFDALTLLISAIGHDVGHPGVNNAFLVALNAPLAQLYNDRSVLEAFHCAAYSQILRRYWPRAFADTAMRKLMINSILATDMGLHFYYVADMSKLEESLTSNPIDKQTPKDLETMRDLCCGLLIKCADISNVAREYAIARRWARILTEEFSNQGAMEQELDLPTCLFGGPPDLSDGVKMAESQVAFMSSFAKPLFKGVSAILPAMSFGIDEMDRNQVAWQKTIEDLKEKEVGKVKADDSETFEHESEHLPSLVAERDPVPEVELAPPPVENQSRSQGDCISSAERRLRNASLNSLTPIRSHRKASGSGSYQGPFALPFAHQHNGSRRSSKDAALDQLDAMQFNSFSRLDSHSGELGRRGSADASLTTILVHSGAAQSKRDASQPTPPASPTRPAPRSSSQPNNAIGYSSLPSSRGNTTGNSGSTHDGARSMSTQASSFHEVENKVMSIGEPSNSAMSSTLLSPGLPTAEQRQTLSAPDILAIPDIGQSRRGLVPHITGDGFDVSEDPGPDGRPGNLRQSRSRSRLRGLRFWRKRWKSPAATEVENSDGV